MTPKTASKNQSQLIEQICDYIQSAPVPPSLADLSEIFTLSPHHLQKTFKQHTGVSPHEYAEAVRMQRLKANLRDGQNITGAIYDAGYKSGSNVYQRTAAVLGMTPSHYKSGGKNVAVCYTTVACPIGKLLVAATDQGLCALFFGDSAEHLTNELLEEFPHASIKAGSNAILDQAIATITGYLQGELAALEIPLDLQGTDFQKKVWKALAAIPRGQTKTYSQIAQSIGQPQACRAVARACATNLVSLVIPCHRVIRTAGTLGGYRWGLKRKQALLKIESEA